MNISLILEQVFDHPFERKKILPDWEDVQEWTNQSKDGHRVKGWAWSPQGSVGTAILCHGFTQSAFSGPVKKVALYLKARRDLALVSLNFRSHGPSRDLHRFPPSFGEAEKWDIRAALEYAESMNLPKPFVVIGFSLGAMAASRITQQDGRVTAAFLIGPPYKAKHAIRVQVKNKTLAPMHRIAPDLIEKVLNRVYKNTRSKILNRSDVREYDMSPPHRPFIGYWIGKRDEYGWELLYEKIYRKWYGGMSQGALGELPGDVAGRRTWFVTSDCGHHVGRDEWPDCERVLAKFLAVALSL